MPPPELPLPPDPGLETPVDDTAPPGPAADPGEAALKKPSLAFVLDRPPEADASGQTFERSFGTPPCKAPRTGQPTAYMAVVGLFVVLLVGVLVFMVVKHYVDLHKPHVPLQHMPMRVIEGQRVIPTNTWR